MEKIIQYCSHNMKVSCDGKCNKAWGVSLRQKVQLSEDIDDFYFLSDSELGEAPIDPGSYEGGHAKPISVEYFPNKWCVRECERCKRGEVNEEIKLPDFNKRLYNKQ